MRLLRGFGLTVVGEEHTPEELLALTQGGLRVRQRDIERAHPSRFSGVALADGQIEAAWVRTNRTPIWAEPVSTDRPADYATRLSRVRLSRRDGPEGYYQTDRGWMRATSLRVPTRALRPASVGENERWLDVELATQTLVAYEGDRPVYATLVSTGVGRPGSAFATPIGELRITAKLERATMSNLEHTQVVPYFYEEVPYTQYMGRIALHGVYWHDRFGEPQSHGCINVSLADAAWLFAFTKPSVQTGQARYTLDQRPTLVRVR